MEGMELNQNIAGKNEQKDPRKNARDLTIQLHKLMEEIRIKRVSGEKIDEEILDKKVDLENRIHACGGVNREELEEE